VGHNVGIRPYRSSGMRIEKEVKGQKIVHAYGTSRVNENIPSPSKTDKVQVLLGEVISLVLAWHGRLPNWLMSSCFLEGKLTYNLQPMIWW
jgi:hypothetical protein